MTGGVLVAADLLPGALGAGASTSTSYLRATSPS